MSNISQSNYKRIAKNTAFLYIRMFFVLIISLYTSRVVLNTLGVNDYGTFNVVGGFVSMFGFLNATLSASMQRFYNIEGTKDRENGYMKVFSSGLVIHIALGGFLFLLLETLGLWYVNTLMVVPDGRLFAANVVYQFSIISIILVVLQIPFTGALIADERMDFYAIISIIDIAFKLLAVIILPYLAFDKLIIYGLLLLLITTFDLLSYAIFAKKTVLKFDTKIEFDKQLFKSIISFSSWNLIGTFAFLLKGQGLNILLNAFFGTIINAARGIAYQVNNAITGFSANISMAFRPQIVNSFADRNYSRCANLMFSESKICYSLLLLLITPVVLEMEYLLQLWLGDVVPEHTKLFAILVLIDSLICTLNTPVSQVASATGNIKLFQIISSCINLLLLPTCYIFMKLEFNAEWVFIITIIFSMLNQCGCLFALKKIFNFSIGDYSKKVILPCLLLTVILPLGPYFVRGLIIQSFTRLLLVGFTVVLIYIPINYFFILNEQEKINLKKIIKR